MIGNLGFTEILLILALALIVVGPKKLPGIAHSIGKALGEFRRATKDFKDTLEAEVDLSDKHPAKLKESDSETRWPEEQTDEFLAEDAGGIKEDWESAETQEEPSKDTGKEADHAG